MVYITLPTYFIKLGLNYKYYLNGFIKNDIRLNLLLTIGVPVYNNRILTLSQIIR